MKLEFIDNTEVQSIDLLDITSDNIDRLPPNIIVRITPDDEEYPDLPWTHRGHDSLDPIETKLIGIRPDSQDVMALEIEFPDGIIYGHSGNSHIPTVTNRYFIYLDTRTEDLFT